MLTKRIRVSDRLKALPLRMQKLYDDALGYQMAYRSTHKGHFPNRLIVHPHTWAKLGDIARTRNTSSAFRLEDDQLIVFDCQVYRSEDVPPQNFIYFEV